MLSAIMQWLARAQDARPGDRGIASHYSLYRGWWVSYPETTGYVTNTFLRYDRQFDSPEFGRRALEAVEWLLTLQYGNGAFPGSGEGAAMRPTVFNTGMILFGLAEVYARSGEARFAAAGRRAGDWLVSVLDQDGCWRDFNYQNGPHAYNAYAALGLLKMAQALGGVAAYEEAARRVGEWTLSQQDEAGWFRSNEFIPGRPPLTHNLAYLLAGLLGLGEGLGERRLLAAASEAADIVLDDLLKSGTLASAYGPGWQRGPGFRCVTGEAQFGLIWADLFRLTGERRYWRAVQTSLDLLAGVVQLRHPLGGVRGGVPGAWPIWARYVRFGYPSWAAKFSADLLMVDLAHEPREMGG